MLTFNTTARRWCAISLRFVSGMTRLACFSLITVPAVLCFVLMLPRMSSSPGEEYLRFAEALVRGAPPGSVMACPFAPVVTDADGRPQPPPVLKPDCIREPMPRDEWISRVNTNATFIYKAGVLLGVVVWLVSFSSRRAAKKEAGYGKN